MASFGRKSQAKLDTVHNVLEELCTRVVEHQDITILVGHRPEDKQNAAYNSGNSSKKWPDSNHNLMPSMAIDVAPWPIPDGWGDLNWKERVKFYEVIAIVRFCWGQLCKEFPEVGEKYRLRLGADWDGDGDYRDQKFDDLPHIELVEV